MDANFCNHKRTSHMTQLTPWRYLEKGKYRMGGWGVEKRKVYMRQGCKKEDI